jgi:hypothetical protein
VTSYEIETVANGRHRDVTVNGKGNVTTIEEETPLDSIPPAAKAAIEKKVATVTRCAPSTQHRSID